MTSVSDSDLTQTSTRSCPPASNCSPRTICSACTRSLQCRPAFSSRWRGAQPTWPRKSQRANQHASQALGRLLSAGWVTRTKPSEGADRRNSLYTIADPAVREFVRDRLK